MLVGSNVLFKVVYFFTNYGDCVFFGECDIYIFLYIFAVYTYYIRMRDIICLGKICR